jgi:hypothetical protein
MTDIDPENMSKSCDEDWALFPFDQTTDGRRWVRLIEELDSLWSKVRELQTSDGDPVG